MNMYNGVKQYLSNERSGIQFKFLKSQNDRKRNLSRQVMCLRFGIVFHGHIDLPVENPQSHSGGINKQDLIHPGYVTRKHEARHQKARKHFLTIQ